MEEMSGGSGWWWGLASAGQFGGGITMYMRGCSSQLMPFKAFTIASLFVGATASASVSLLRSYQIHSVEDMKGVGTNIKKWIRNIPGAQANKQEDATK